MPSVQTDIRADDYYLRDDKADKERQVRPARWEASLNPGLSQVVDLKKRKKKWPKKKAGDIDAEHRCHRPENYKDRFTDD